MNWRGNNKRGNSFFWLEHLGGTLRRSSPFGEKTMNSFMNILSFDACGPSKTMSV